MKTIFGIIVFSIPAILEANGVNVGGQWVGVVYAIFGFAGLAIVLEDCK